MYQFVVHSPADDVGVVIVEGVQAGQPLTGWILDQEETLNITALQDIPIGHKFALREIVNGSTVLKYGHDIGRAVAAIKTGEHVHIHNLKTKRW
mgnify:CR=1 FL=1|jgi:(2R)-sulfolactate sulfo-lyase subunit alpha